MRGRGESYGWKGGDGCHDVHSYTVSALRSAPTPSPRGQCPEITAYPNKVSGCRPAGFRSCGSRRLTVDGWRLAVVGNVIVGFLRLASQQLPDSFPSPVPMCTPSTPRRIETHIGSYRCCHLMYVHTCCTSTPSPHLPTPRRIETPIGSYRCPKVTPPHVHTCCSSTPPHTQADRDTYWEFSMPEGDPTGAPIEVHETLYGKAIKVWGVWRVWRVWR